MTAPRPTVILLHGLAANKLLMRPIARHLSRNGYATINWGYWSTRGDIKQHAVRLAETLQRLEDDPAVSIVYLVVHSMGGIVARVALQRNEFNKVERMVMLGPPNRGSKVAAILSRGLGWFCTPLRQLSDESQSLVRTLAPPENVHVGVLAANFDRVVAVDSTHLPTEADHRVIPSGHTSMLFRHDVADYVLNFLREGMFQPAPCHDGSEASLLPDTAKG